MAANHVAEAQRAVDAHRKRIATLNHGGRDYEEAHDLLQINLCALDIARRDYERAESGR
ncbi:hypothetical protein [Novosphingobium sp. 9U]|uniref:hypothetical protein n=1 Tax=Novosphingobium sp. 9U TaxID=2653158 RepID=UPI00135B3345|nr:hypothetical protein [Novosphingobium sp. 9U]